MTCLRFTPMENNRCWTVVDVLGAELVAQVTRLSPGLCTITPNRPLSQEEVQSIEDFMVHERRKQRRAKRNARSLEWLEGLYALTDTRAA